MKKLIAGALAAASLATTAMVAAAPAQASDICYFESSRQALGKGNTYGCRVSHRRNQNGTPVVDVTWHDGLRSSYVFWGSGTVEIFSNNQRHVGRFTVDYAGGRRVAVIVHNSNAATVFPID